MGLIPANKFFCSFLLLCAAACVLQPVMADNGTITIAYRGIGEGYLGETYVFDGLNTFGNTTLLKITGLGLPSDGVPVNNLYGPAGTATSVGVDKEGKWKYVWYGSAVSGLEKLQTGRYTFTAMDSENPEHSTTTTLKLNKPEFYIRASPNPSNPGDYIELTGSAEKDITYVKIEVADASGRVLHVFTSPVGSSGYLSYSFHGDMDPGQYTVTMTNPSLQTPYKTVLSVVATEGTLPVTTLVSPEIPSTVRTVDMTVAASPAPVSETRTPKTPVALITILGALTAGVVVAGISRRS
jgi:hypothetical protein